MALAAWVLSLVLALPVAKDDRAVDPTVKREQAETVAAAITEAVEGVVDARRWPGEARELAALMVVVARYESALALHVHAGDCPRRHKPEECDRGRARGLWQQQESSVRSRVKWLLLVGTDEQSTKFAAREAASALVRARWQCRSLERSGGDWMPLVFSAYAGRGCVGWFRGRDLRVAALRRALAA